MDKIDIITIAILFIIAFSLWTIPIQNDPRPFGEGDAAWHLSIGDYIASSDKPIWRLPFYIGQWYYGYNPKLGPYAPEYPPPNHYNYALMQVAGGERFIPIIMYRGIASFLGIFAVYFLVTKLFGRPAAIVASTGLLFSIREQMIYLWGQQPTLISVVIAPVTFYAFYRFLDSYYKRQTNNSYLYAATLLLASQFLLHIQGFVLSAVVIGVFTLLMFIKHRKIPLIRSTKHVLIAGILFLALTLPFFQIYFGVDQAGQVAPDFGRLFKWNVDYSVVSGSYSSAFIEFSESYPKYFIILILLSLPLFALRLGNRDLLMLSWLAGIYFVLHVDVFLGTGQERAARLLIAEPALFYSMVGIAATSILSLFNIPLKVLSSTKYVIAGILVFIIVTSNAAESKALLDGAYQSILRITPAQSEMANWMRDTLPENAYIFYIPENADYKLGTWQYQKLRWMLATSQRYVGSYYIGLPGQTEKNPGNPDNLLSPYYFIFDYSDLVLMGPNIQPVINSLQEFEVLHFNETAPIFNKNNIRVYEVEAKDFE